MEVRVFSKHRSRREKGDKRRGHRANQGQERWKRTTDGKPQKENEDTKVNRQEDRPRQSTRKQKPDSDETAVGSTGRQQGRGGGEAPKAGQDDGAFLCSQLSSILTITTVPNPALEGSI